MKILRWEFFSDTYLSGFWVGNMFINPYNGSWDEYSYDSLEYNNAKFIEILRYD